MEKSDKRKKIENILLMIIFLILAAAVVVLYNRNVKITKAKKAEEAANVTLTDIAYGSEITQLGKKDAKGILDAFIDSYNTKNGEAMVAISDFPAQYIFAEEAEEDISKFDDKYVSILSNVTEYDDLIMMRYTLPKQEEGTIEAIKNTNVKLEVVDNTEIENVTKYVSKFTANIRTYSETENIDQTDKLEFILLNKQDSYYIINYYVVDENGNKIQ